jgi:alpha-glucosidase
MKGTYEPLSAQGDLLLYRRKVDGQSATVALNLGAEPASIASASIGFGHKVLLSTFLDRHGEQIEGVLDLRGNEGVIVGDDHYAG